MTPDITWLWSTPRSGAGLLLSLLSHPLRPDPSAALGFGPQPPAATSSPGVLPIDELCLGVHLAPWPGEIVAAGDRLVPGTMLSFNEARPPYLLSRAAAASWRGPLRDLVHARIDHARELAASHVRDLDDDVPVVVKEVTSSYAADRVTDLMPETRSIVVVRDPRDVAASFITVPDTFEEDDSVRDIERRTVVLEVAERWAMTVDCFGTALAGRGDDAALEITFEDLIERPERELKRACKLIGLDRGRSQIREAVAMDRSLNPAAGSESSLPVDLRTHVGAWRELLSSEEASEVERIAGPRLAAFGYEPA